MIHIRRWGGGGGGGIDDTKTMSQIFSSKNSVYQKCIFSALFFNSYYIPARTMSITGFTTT